jgi:hypothetical protein
VFVVQMITGVQIIGQSADSGNVNQIAVLVIVCFLIGIARAWELIGGPSIGLTREVTSLISGQNHEAAEPEDDQPPPS